MKKPNIDKIDLYDKALSMYLKSRGQPYQETARSYAIRAALSIRQAYEDRVLAVALLTVLLVNMEQENE